jgi:hypothetical protein
VLFRVVDQTIVVRRELVVRNPKGPKGTGCSHDTGVIVDIGLHRETSRKHLELQAVREDHA